MVYELSNMAWWEAEEKIRNSKLVIIPVGATEQHGLHLGVGADWIQANEIARRVGEKSDVLVLPTLTYGVSGHHVEFPGTITLSESTYQEVIYELLSNLNRLKVGRVVFINGHGGNTSSIISALKRARESYGMIGSILEWWTVWGDRTIFGQKFEAHAGYSETAFMLAARPEAVKMEYAVLSPTKQYDDNIEIIRAGKVKYEGGVVWLPLKTGDVTDTGSMTEASPIEAHKTRDYTMITREFSVNLMNEYVDWICSFLKKFENMVVPPIKITKEKAMGELNG
jgi:creatinine amidohydrolase